MRSIETPAQKRANGLRSARIVTAMALAAAAVLAAAHAARTSAASAATKVSVALEGRITAECSVSGAASVAAGVEVGDITKPGSKEVAYAINCNTPFKYSLVSQHGALQHEAAKVPAGFAARVPYRVAVHIPTDDVTISDACDSASIQAGQVTCRFSDSRNGIAIDRQAKVTMAWVGETITLLAGDYSDRLTFTVEVKP